MTSAANRKILFFTIICLVVWLGTGSPLNSKRRLINRPSEDKLFDLNRHRRTPYNNMNTKGGQQSSHQRPVKPMELQLRKGEYVCNGKICRLQPGEIPEGCNGMCQHRV